METSHSRHAVIEPSILYVGTPVVLLSTENDDGSANLAPMSSAWALGHTVVLGIGRSGQTAYNLARRPDVVINLPGPAQWEAVERLAPLTGRHPVPPTKPAGCRYEPDKFAAAGLHMQPSEVIRPPRVAECALQLEATATSVRLDASDSFVIVEAAVHRVHADPRIVVPGTHHIDPGSWAPLIYSFRHYFALGQELGHSYRTDTPSRGAATARPRPGRVSKVDLGP
ncbi:flavin reductase family protein [Uniformispora flossi]|uniref:flavin reductase family protein n=1 Tax=Uniformispora flossi TaxID=3390723 RepID=UPI003C2EFAB2